MKNMNVSRPITFIELSIFALSAFWTSVPHCANAMPANPSVREIVQPDGTKLNVITKGDEYQGWQETTEGYTVVRNKRTRFFEYANLNPQGDLVPSGVVATPSRLHVQGLPGVRPAKGLRPRPNIALAKEQQDWLRQLRLDLHLRVTPQLGLPPGAPSAPGTLPTISGTWAPHPVIGPKKLLLILVNFQDVTLKEPASYWSNLVFGANGPSVAKYYSDNSYGKVTITPVANTQPSSPPGIVTVTLPEPNPNYGNQSDYSTETAWVNKALAAAAAFVDFPSLDTNGDGTITVDER